MLLILISASHHSDFSMMPEFTIKSCIHGYHVRMWSNFDSNIMLCKHEIGNVVDQYVVAARTLVVYFCFSFDKSQYGNKVDHGYAISHMAGLCCDL